MFTVHSLVLTILPCVSCVSAFPEDKTVITDVPKPTPLKDCHRAQTTLEAPFGAGPITYCQCGKGAAAIKTETADKFLYEVCAAAPYPTVGTITI
ncbi:MAG: hypothetical protein Q9208_006178 [Pyrenodesmia sp. 3 TL-2023]